MLKYEIYFPLLFQKLVLLNVIYIPHKYQNNEWTVINFTALPNAKGNLLNRV